MTIRIKIRGIYSTALTKLLLDGGYSVVQSSTKIMERFDFPFNDEPFDISVHEKDDLQGIKVCGEPENVSQFVTFLQETLIDSILMGCAPMEEPEEWVTAELEFPGTSKEILDQVRLEVTPTLMRHHRLRITDTKALEPVEFELLMHPEKKKTLEDKLFFEAILLQIEKAGTVKLEHIRPSGKAIRPREGILVNTHDNKIVFKRSFSSGRYDGLDLNIQHGDYGLTELQEGAWHVKHSYYTKEGRLIGEYYNINTPVELYPYGARYVDLEIDVVRRAGHEVSLIDREKLSMLGQNGCIGSALERKAMEVAEEIMHSLQSVSTEVSPVG